MASAEGDYPAGENSASQINRRRLRQPAKAGRTHRRHRTRSGRNAFLVGAGIVLSRISGVVREGFLAAWLGTRSSADAFSAALRIPKLLQNLLGEGSLSASFIPVYSQVLQRGDERRAGHVAGAVAGLLTLLTGGLVLFSVLLARPLASVVAPGFSGQKHELTVHLIRIVAPGVGFLVLSAWCLGVLNSHRRFFLSYVAPVLWNTAIIVGLATAGIRAWAEPNIAEAAAWGVLIGGAFAVSHTVARCAGRGAASANHFNDPLASGAGSGPEISARCGRTGRGYARQLHRPHPRFAAGNRRGGCAGSRSGAVSAADQRVRCERGCC